MRILRFLPAIVPLLMAYGAAAGDLQREKYWSEVLAAAVDPVQQTWLDADGGKFLALYKEGAGGAPEGGVILLHDMAGHPDWPEVISPLRTRLPGYGWSTLSLQLPVLLGNAPVRDYAPLFEETPARILAGIGYLQARGIRNIVCLGYGLGATMGAAFLAENATAGVAAFAAISVVSHPEVAPHLDAAAALEKITLPVLDMYGERDLDPVRDTAAARAAAARRAGLAAARTGSLEPLRRSVTARMGLTEETGLVSYRLFAIGGADHAFPGQEDTLVRRVAGWLKRHAEGKASASEALPD